MSGPVGGQPVGGQPVVGLTAYAVRARFGVWDDATVLLPRAYVDAVVDAGAVPVLLPPVVGDPAAARAVLARLDALVLVGGPDVDPARYGQPAGPDTQAPSAERDRAELALLAAAVDDGLPVLAVCRGLQLLNVARGGTLHQHLPDVVGHEEHAPAPGVVGHHPVRVAPGSRLARALGGCEVAAVPTYHHQGVDVLGRGLVAVAWAPDGVVEAVEDPALAFCLGVQWHPELGVERGLFTALVEAARERADRERADRERAGRVG